VQTSVMALKPILYSRCSLERIKLTQLGWDLEYGFDRGEADTARLGVRTLFRKYKDNHAELGFGCSF